MGDGARDDGARRIGRRGVLRAGAFAIAGGALAAFLQACGGTTATSTTGATGGGGAVATTGATGGGAGVTPTTGATGGASATATTAGTVPSAAGTAGGAATARGGATVAGGGPAVGTPSGGVVGTINAPDMKKYAGQTINLAVQEHTATDAIKKLAGGFEQQTGIKVSFEQIPQQQLNQKQITDMSTGTGAYDVIGWFLTPEYIANKWIVPVDDLRKNATITDEKLLALDDFFPKFLQYYQYQDKLYGLPFYGESLMLYYNTEEFARVGIAKAPDTLADLEDACKKIKAGGRMAGLSLRGSQEGNAAIYPFLAWLYGHGAYWFKQTGEIGLNAPEAIEAADSWGRFLRDYGPPDVASYFWNEVQLSMQQEKAAIVYDATNFGPRLEDPAQSKIAGKIGYAPLPMVMGPNGPRGPKATGGRFGYSAGTYALSVPTTSKKQEPAWLFIQWATSPDVMLATTQLGLRGDPTRRSSLNSPQFISKYNFGNGNWAKTQAQSFEYAMPDYWPPIITGTELGDTLGLALSQILTGQQSAAQALKDAYDKSVTIQKKAGLLK